MHLTYYEKNVVKFDVHLPTTQTPDVVHVRACALGGVVCFRKSVMVQRSRIVCILRIFKRRQSNGTEKIYSGQSRVVTCK